MRLTRTAAVLTTAALAAGIGVSTAEAESGRSLRATGPTYVHNPAYEGTNVDVHAVTAASGRTIVTLDLWGLPDSVRGTVLGAHVHTGSCGAAPVASGPHYSNPSAPAGTPIHESEIWLDSRVNPAGRASAVAVVDWAIAAGDARSIVVHALPTAPNGTAGARLLCTDVQFGTTG